MNIGEPAVACLLASSFFHVFPVSFLVQVINHYTHMLPEAFSNQRMILTKPRCRCCAPGGRCCALPRATEGQHVPARCTSGVCAHCGRWRLPEQPLSSECRVPMHSKAKLVLLPLQPFQSGSRDRTQRHVFYHWSLPVPAD